MLAFGGSARSPSLPRLSGVTRENLYAHIAPASGPYTRARASDAGIFTRMLPKEDRW
jgi:hypothetical protein